MMWRASEMNAASSGLRGAERIRSVSCLHISRRGASLMVVSRDHYGWFPPFFRSLWHILLFAASVTCVHRYHLADRFSPPGKCVRPFKLHLQKQCCVFIAHGRGCDWWRPEATFSKYMQFIMWIDSVGRLFICFWGGRGLAGVKMIIGGVHYRLSLLVSICWWSSGWLIPGSQRCLEGVLILNAMPVNRLVTSASLCTERAVEERRQIGSVISPTVINIQPLYTTENLNRLPDSLLSNMTAHIIPQNISFSNFLEFKMITLSVFSTQMVKLFWK